MVPCGSEAPSRLIFNFLGRNILATDLRLPLFGCVPSLAKASAWLHTLAHRAVVAHLNLQSRGTSIPPKSEPSVLAFSEHPNQDRRMARRRRTTTLRPIDIMQTTDEKVMERPIQRSNSMSLTKERPYTTWEAVSFEDRCASNERWTCRSRHLSRSGF